MRRSSARSSGFGCPLLVIRDSGNTGVSADACGVIPPRRGDADALIEDCLPPSVNPFLKVRALCADGGVEAMPGQNDGFGREGEQFGVN